MPTATPAVSPTPAAAVAPTPAAASAAATRRRDLPTLAFRVVGGLVAGSILTGPGGLQGLASPWATLPHATDGLTPELHRWHGTDLTALVTLLMCGSLLALLWRPRARPVLAQATLVAAGALAAGGLATGVSKASLPCLTFIGLVLATYPRRRALLSLSSPQGPSRPLLAVAVAAAPLLVWNAVTNIRYEVQGVGGEHAVFHHWMGAAALAAALLVLGFLAATRRPGYAALGALLGGTYLYLGVAALQIPGHDGSWGVSGGLAALVGGAAFLRATWRAARPTLA
jgi:hypothetical protein